MSDGISDSHAYYVKSAIEVYPWAMRRPQLDEFLKMIDAALDAGKEHKCFVCGDTRPPKDELCQGCDYPKD